MNQTAVGIYLLRIKFYLTNVVQVQLYKELTENLKMVINK